MVEKIKQFIQKLKCEHDMGLNRWRLVHFPEHESLSRVEAEYICTKCGKTDYLHLCGEERKMWEDAMGNYKKVLQSRKVIVNGEEIDACCTRPKYIKAYIWFSFFPAVVCKNCGEVIGVLGGFRAWVFNLFFAPFWNGQVLIDTEELSEKELEKIVNSHGVSGKP